MARSAVWNFCFIVIVTPVVVQCISVVGPRLLRPFNPYRIAVAGGPRAQSLYVALEGRRANGEQYQQGREVQVQPASSRLIDLEVGDPGPGHYMLVARSTSGPQFSSSAPLIYQPRSFCVFIQTDKRVYQPGDTINFRVIALDKSLLPLAGAADVSVVDARGAAVRQWAAAPLQRGLLSADFALADQPALGQWTIQVEVRGQTYSRQILVADYVSPKFHMEIQTPKEMLFSDGRFDVNVTAKHFNGLPVRGELTISIYAVFFSGVLQPVYSSPSRKVVEFNGQTDVTYDLKTDLDLAEDAARPLVIEAVLEEKDTLIKQNVSTRILLLRTRYRLKVTAPEYFKPTLPYNVQVEVVDPSGQLMEIDGEATVERLWDDGAPVNITTIALNKGVATYTIISDSAHASSTLNLVVKYKEVSERVVNVQSSAASGGQYLTIENLTPGPSVGGELRARVSASEPMDLLNYVVIGRGDILHAKTVELSPSRRSVDVTVPVTADMAPGSIVLAWYPRLDPIGDTVVASALYVPQHNLLQHEVTLDVTGDGSRPGGAVEIRVMGEGASHAALLAEDAKAIAAGLISNDGLGSGLELHKIEREVESFNGLKHSIFKNEDHQPIRGIDLGGNTTADVFHNAGVVVLTDGVIASSTLDDQSQPPMETGTRPPLAGPYAFSRLPPPPSPRYYLTVDPQPTWMLANFTLENDGKGAVNRRTPMTSGEWLVGAFAIHPTLGLGLATPKILRTEAPLTITAELPQILQKGETLAAVITLHSTLTVDTSIELTFHNSEQYFEFEPLDNGVDSTKKIELFRRLRVTVPARGLASTAFLVTVVRDGEAPVIVEASGNGVSASLFKTIDVKDGYEEEVWSWEVLDGRRGVARGTVVLTAAPGVALAGAALRAGGDLLAPALRAARDAPAPAADPVLALRPLARSAVLLDYLQATGRDDAGVTASARAQAAAGYQQLLAYRLPDGSFAPDLSDDAVGDVWMTSQAARWLSRAARHVQTEPGAAAAAARWLAQAQTPAGDWTPPPRAERHDPRAQRPLPLAAHALMALLAVQSPEAVQKNAINKAIDFVARGLSAELDAYSLAVVGSALFAARHPRAAEALTMLDSHVNATGSSRWWGRRLEGAEWRNPWLRENSAEASTAAWGLRAMLAARLPDQAVPVARFLLSAYHPADIDPDVLDSLSELAKMIKSPTKMRVLVNVTSSEEPRQFNIDDDNALIVQTQLVRGATNASARCEGRGVAVLGMTAAGRTCSTAPWPRYTLDPRVDAVSTPHRLQLSVCVGFVPQGNETISGFTLLTVQLPSGYLADINTITELTAARHVSAARLAAGGSRVLAWLRPLEARERCATLAAPRALPVAEQRAGLATLIDLYDSSHRARVFFQPVAAHACDVCRAWESCARACGAAAERRGDGAGGGDGVSAKPGSAAISVASPLVALLAAAVVLR